MWPRAYRLVRDQLQRFAAGEEPVNVMTGRLLTLDAGT